MIRKLLFACLDDSGFMKVYLVAITKVFFFICFFPDIFKCRAEDSVQPKNHSAPLGPDGMPLFHSMIKHVMASNFHIVIIDKAFITIYCIICIVI